MKIKVEQKSLCLATKQLQRILLKKTVANQLPICYNELCLI